MLSRDTDGRRDERSDGKFSESRELFCSLDFVHFIGRVSLCFAFHGSYSFVFVVSSAHSHSSSSANGWWRRRRPLYFSSVDLKIPLENFKYLREPPLSLSLSLEKLLVKRSEIAISATRERLGAAQKHRRDPSSFSLLN